MKSLSQMTIHKTKNKSELEQRLIALNQYKIDLGLDRLKLVIERLDVFDQIPHVITVGGTNGKGSTVTAICSLLSTQNKSFGAFTSPHIHQFNERININGNLASDDEILNAFALIDAAKAEINLSYFEYAFLAAVLNFIKHEVDVIVLEVGLGGRLDATNALDSDASVITTIDLDHTEWLGDDIETIAKEKAGIMRPGKPVVFGDKNTPSSIISQAKSTQSKLIQQVLDYQVTLNDHGFDYCFNDTSFDQLQLPQLKGDYQVFNFSSALTVLLSLGYVFTPEQVKQAIQAWHIKGRLQTIQSKPLVIADVAHNRQSAQQLAQYLMENPIKGHTYAVFSVLADKQVETWLDELNKIIDHWFIFELNNDRALNIFDLKTILADKVSLFSQFNDAESAFKMAQSMAGDNDRIIVFGSFHVLDEVLNVELLKNKGLN